MLMCSWIVEAVLTVLWPGQKGVIQVVTLTVKRHYLTTSLQRAFFGYAQFNSNVLDVIILFVVVIVVDLLYKVE